MDIDENNKQISKLSKNIDKLTQGLNDEKVLRNKVNEMVTEAKKNFDKAEIKINDKLEFFKGALWLSTALAGVFITILITWLAGWLEF